MRRLVRAMLVLIGIATLLILVQVGRFMPLFEGWAEREVRHEAPAAPAPSERLVVLVSIDGLAPWVLEQEKPPTLTRLAREGTHAREARTVQPSVTLTSHTSMLSGVSPEHHGVLWNRYEPWHEITVPTVFAVCRATGLRCGLFAGKTKFVHFAESEPGVMFYGYADAQERVLAMAAETIREDALDFAFVHLAEVDLAGHEHGWGSEEQREQIAAIDGSLGRFVEELSGGGRPFTLIVTADHGGYEMNHFEERPENWRIPWLAYGDTAPRGGVIDHASTLDTAPTVLTLLGRPVPDAMEGHALLR